MALKSGFFNSVTEDRVYDAVDFTRYLAGIISDGFAPAYGAASDTGFEVVPNTEPMNTDPPSVVISAGKAYLNGYWIINDAPYIFNLADEQQVVAIKHLVHLCLDTNNDGREITVEVVSGADPALPADGAGKYYMAIAKVTDLLDENPTATEIEDLRTLAGVTAISVDTDVIVDGAVTTDKIDDEAITTDKLDDEAVTSDKLSPSAAIMSKLGTDIYIPIVTASISLTPEGTIIYGATTAAITPSVASVAMITVGVFDLGTSAPAPPITARIEMSYQIKVGTAAWADLLPGSTPMSVVEVSGSKAGGVFTYPYSLTAGVVYQFRVRAKSATIAQTSAQSFIYGFILPRV